MRIAEVSTPSGRIAEVRIPDGADPAAYIAEFQKRMPPEPSASPEPDFQKGVREYGVPDSPSTMQNLLTPAGRTFDKLDAGARDLGLRAQQFALPGVDNTQALQQIEQQQAYKDYLFEPFSQEHPGKTMFMGEAPYALLPGKAIPEAAASFVEYAPSLGQRAGQAALVGAGSYAGAKGADLGVGRPVKRTVPKRHLARMNKAKKMGFEAAPSDIRGGNKRMQGNEARMESTPGPDEVIGNFYARNNQRYNRVVGEALGVDDAVALTDDVLQEAKPAIVKRMRDAFHGDTMQLDSKFRNEIIDIVDEFNQVAGRKGSTPATDLESRLTDFVEMLDGAKKGKITADDYMRQASGLATDARSATDGAYEQALLEIREALDGAMERSTGNLPEMRQARNQYRTLMMVEGAIDPASGNVSPRKLSNILKRKDKHGYLYGNTKSDLYTATRFMIENPRSFGSSGTAERSFTRLSRMKEGAGAGAGVGAGIGSLLGNPGAGAATGAAVGAGAGLLSPELSRIAAAHYLSPNLNMGALPMGLMREGLPRYGIESAAQAAMLGITPQAAENTKERLHGLLQR